jgi:hypothetical protein
MNKKGSLRDSMILPLSGGFVGKDKLYSNVFDISEYGMNEEEFIDLAEMTMIIVINTFLKYETEKLSKEEIIKIFKRRIEILKNGSRKREI